MGVDRLRAEAYDVGERGEPERLADRQVGWPGRRTLTQGMTRAAPVGARLLSAQDIARDGAAGGGRLPHADAIQRAFGRHDVSRVRAQVGGPAAQASATLGARAYAMEDFIGFASAPDLFTAAHEAAHVIQQRDGVQLASLAGSSGALEEHADAVAGAVVAGQSAETLLDAVPAGAMPAPVQLWAEGEPARAGRQAVLDFLENATSSDQVQQLISALEQAQPRSPEVFVEVQLPGAQAVQVHMDDVDPLLRQARRAETRDPQQRPDANLDRTGAQQELLQWNQRAIRFIDGNRAWLSANWGQYLERTSTNPSLSWTEGVVHGTISNALGNLLTELGEAQIRRAGGMAASAIGAAIGTAAAPGVGTAVGFVIGVLVEQTAGMIYDAINDEVNPDDSRQRAGESTGRAINAQNAQFDAQASAALAEHNTIFEAAQQNLTEATAQDEIDRIEAWARDAKRLVQTSAPRSNRALAQRMIDAWVLEHAGDEEDPNRDTDEAQWRERRDESFGGELDGQPALFAHQSRGEWARAGLGSSVDLVQRAEEIVAARRSQGRRDLAAALQETFDNQRHELTVRDRDAWRRYYQANSNWYNSDTREASLVSCTLDLTTADDTCYVDEWEYSLGPMNGFNVSPD